MHESYSEKLVIREETVHKEEDKIEDGYKMRSPSRILNQIWSPQEARGPNLYRINYISTFM